MRVVGALSVQRRTRQKRKNIFKFSKKLLLSSSVIGSRTPPWLDRYCEQNDKSAQVHSSKTLILHISFNGIHEANYNPKGEIMYSMQRNQTMPMENMNK